jgi:5-methylthioribose kinase
VARADRDTTDATDATDADDRPRRPRGPAGRHSREGVVTASDAPIDADSVVPYLRDRGVVPASADPAVTPLGGGVSNAVFRVDWGEDAVVCKRPYPNLDVDDDWPADVGRVHNEAAAARVYAAVAADCPDALGVRVPGVRFEDEEVHVAVFDAAPAGTPTWKSRLLDGEVDVAVAAALGTFLAATHDRTAGDGDVRAAFASYEPFEQLRLDPYHETVARRHPAVADAVRAEADRTRGVRTALVHGDYSPKNVLVDGDVRWLLDFEVAHWGDPAFDVAFLCNHLLIKAVYLAREGPTGGDVDCDCLRAARAVRDAYRDRRTPREGFWADVATELGVLMLARIDGKSPVEYAGEPTRERLRAVATATLRGEARSFDGVVDLVAGGGA